MAKDPRPAQRPTTQTVLIVHNGQTHLGLDVQIGKRRVITERQGAAADADRRRRPPAPQGRDPRRAVLAKGGRRYEASRSLPHRAIPRAAVVFRALFVSETTTGG